MSKQDVGQLVYEVSMDVQELMEARQKIDSQLYGLNKSANAAGQSIDRLERKTDELRDEFTRLASVVKGFYDLHNDDITPLIQRAMDAYGLVPAWLLAHLNRKQMGKPAMMAAMSVLAACCESDVSPLTGDIIPGKSGKWAFVYRAGLMNAVEMVLIAQSLITHGIIGKAKVRPQATTEFRSFDYISAARNHFGMSRSDAEQLTMTEFKLLLNAKYPDQKGFTRDEYDAVADDYLAKKARRLTKK